MCCSEGYISVQGVSYVIIQQALLVKYRKLIYIYNMIKKYYLKKIT